MLVAFWGYKGMHFDDRVDQDSPVHSLEQADLQWLSELSSHLLLSSVPPAVRTIDML